MSRVPESGPRREAKRQQHKRYYSKTAFLYPSRPWTKKEVELVMAHKITDRELSAQIRRSMKSIQNKRSRVLKKREIEAKFDRE